jgi:thymidylate synthase (FAD)
MDILREPRVTLLARPQFLAPSHLPVQWKGDSTDGERLAEFAGRLCYMSQHNPAGRTTAEYLGNILKQGHGSVFEHSTYVVLIEGISRSCSHELVRHRAGWGYSQLSQRYVDESHAAFVMPPAILGDPELEAEWTRQVETAQAAYVAAVERLMARYEWLDDKVHRRKMAREAARSVLAHHAGTPSRRGRGAGDPSHGGRVPPSAAAGSAVALCRFRDLQTGRRQRGGTGGVPQGVKKRVSP